jgi:Fe-S-cluster containining protein
LAQRVVSAVPPQPGPRALAVAAKIRAHLRDLAESGTAPDPVGLDGLGALLDRFHAVLFEESGHAPRCSCGCASCCSQAVFDVHAFEIERIGTRLRAEDRARTALTALEERIEDYDATRRAHPRRAGESEDDWIERLAIEFWKLDRPCVLLAPDGSCSVHSARPWACRRYFSLSDPAFCRGETANDPRREGFIAEPADDTDALLAAIDRTMPFDPETDRLDLALARWLRWRSE